MEGARGEFSVERLVQKILTLIEDFFCVWVAGPDRLPSFTFGSTGEFEGF
jgi:hypothetical protein